VNEVKRFKSAILLMVLLAAYFVDLNIYTSCIVSDNQASEEFQMCEQFALNIRFFYVENN